MTIRVSELSRLRNDLNEMCEFAKKSGTAALAPEFFEDLKEFSRRFGELILREKIESTQNREDIRKNLGREYLEDQ